MLAGEPVRDAGTKNRLWNGRNRHRQISLRYAMCDFGSPATSVRSVTLRPRIAPGVPFRVSNLLPYSSRLMQPHMRTKTLE